MNALERLRTLVRWDTLSDRDRRALIIGLLLLLPALLFFGVFTPYREALASVNDRIVAERALLERETALIEAAHELPEALDAAAARAQRSAGRLIEGQNRVLAEAELTVFLERIASSSKVLLQELRGISDTTWNGPAAVRPVRLAIRGESDLQGVATFLRQLEASPVLTRVAELSIEPAPPPTQTVLRQSDDDDDDDDEDPRAAARRAAQTPRQATDVIQFTALIEAFASAEPDRSTEMERES